ncbi:MAG: hypothetical protein ACHBN1_37920 [Heteroscytonema crispum UTEX LB 1556]
MFQKNAAISLLFLAVIGGINLTLSEKILAEEKDSIVYICIANTTNNDVYVSGEDKVGKSFTTKAQAGGRYWWWWRRERDANRNLTVWLNGQQNQAEYKWTWLSPSKLGSEQACFFNKWNIKKNQEGKLYLEYASGQTDS